MRRDQRHGGHACCGGIFKSRQRGCGGFSVAIFRITCGILPELIELALDGCRLIGVTGGKTLTCTNSIAQHRHAGYGTCQHRLRSARQGGAVFHQRQQCLLHRPRHSRDQWKATGAMNAAQRVAGADHRRRRRGERVELQRCQFVLENRNVLQSLVAQDRPQRTRQGDVAYRDVLGESRM